MTHLEYETRLDRDAAVLAPLATDGKIRNGISGIKSSRASRC